LYDQPHQFEPLLPQSRLEPLIEKSREVFEKSLRLSGAVHKTSLDAIRELVRAMNSYYSNLIEGQGTRPANIERALKADFAKKPDIARRQRIAVAHIEAERELEHALLGTSERDVLQSRFLLRAHAALYGRLAEADRTTDDGVLVPPGELRNAEVDVGQHVPPRAASLPLFLARMDHVYGSARGVDLLLCFIAACHHRAAWVHPFVDGNGRACRLQTHCALFPSSAGLWSASRGLAREKERYYVLLSGADMPRRGDLDGRGNLSESALRAWCEFFIEVCLDQVTFMTSLLNLDTLKSRIAALVAFRAESDEHANYRREAALPLQHVAIAGDLARGDFIRMMGIPQRTAQRTLAQLISDGILVSETPKSPVRIAFPLDSLTMLFPGLYPEAATPNAG